MQAMLGFVWAFFAEKATGLTVMEQVLQPGQTGLLFFVRCLSTDFRLRFRGSHCQRRVYRRTPLGLVQFES